MSIVADLRKQGFDVELSGTEVKIRPGSKLTEEQIFYLKEHKSKIIDELRTDRVVYKYLLSDYPDQWSVIITPCYSLEQVREKLVSRFGRDRFVRVVPLMHDN